MHLLAPLRAWEPIYSDAPELQPQGLGVLFCPQFPAPWSQAPGSRMRVASSDPRRCQPESPDTCFPSQWQPWQQADRPQLGDSESPHSREATAAPGVPGDLTGAGGNCGPRPSFEGCYSSAQAGLSGTGIHAPKPEAGYLIVKTDHVPLCPAPVQEVPHTAHFL